MKTLIEDDELQRSHAMADGSRPFETSRLWEKLAALDLKEFMKLPPRERLACGYYLSGKRRAEAMRTT